MTLAFSIDALGWMGAVCYLTAYGLISVGRLSAQDLSYQLANLAGAVLLTTNTLWHGALPAVTLNIAWGAVALISLVRLLRARQA